MIVAVPSINQNLLPRRFGHMTEITFFEIQDGVITNESQVAITPHHKHEHGEEENHQGNHERHQEIKNVLQKCDELWYKALCKNWRARLEGVTFNLKRINHDTLDEVKAGFKG